MAITPTGKDRSGLVHSAAWIREPTSDRYLWFIFVNNLFVRFALGVFDLCLLEVGSGLD